MRSVSLIGGENEMGKGGAGGDSSFGQRESEVSCAREEGADRTGGINKKKERLLTNGETFFFQKNLKCLSLGKRRVRKKNTSSVCFE